MEDTNRQGANHNGSIVCHFRPAYHHISPSICSKSFLAGWIKPPLYPLTRGKVWSLSTACSIVELSNKAFPFNEGTGNLSTLVGLAKKLSHGKFYLQSTVYQFMDTNE